jgi:GNAT superfamily N-acetyltransferase
MTLSEFIGTPEPRPDNLTCLDSAIPASSAWDEQSIEPVCEGAYATALLTGYPSDGVLLVREANAWEPVGFYLGPTIYVTESHRGRGAAAELMLRCLEHREHPGDWDRTVLGDNLLRRVHRLAVERASAAGEDVPASVLEEYGLPTGGRRSFLHRLFHMV